jgi:hypothetical protein
MVGHQLGSLRLSLGKSEPMMKDGGTGHQKMAKKKMNKQIKI